MKVIGVREEKYIGQSVTGSNCQFSYKDEEMTRHVILGLLSDNTTKVEITLENEEDQCGSGWCLASYGRLSYVIVDNFHGFNYKPKKDIILGDVFAEQVDYSNELFTLEINGGDNFYPRGFYTINKDLLIETPRALEYRPTYIFIGESGIGKSWLASQFKEDVKVFETDSVDKLPNSIVANVIVVGNKNKFDLKSIIERLNIETEPIVCEMKKELDVK